MNPSASSSRSVSTMDQAHLEQIRANVRRLLVRAATYAGSAPARLLDIAPQVHEGARRYFPEHVTVDTLDIDPQSGATHIADLCKTNAFLGEGFYDFVVCTEVLEHVENPFDAVAEMFRILKPGGIVFVSTPFNLRIHGPLPDCWRFTEHGLKVLFRAFEILVLEALDTPERFLMPIHYITIARKRAQPGII
jgi:SAM-dependent methyltransferase